MLRYNGKWYKINVKPYEPERQTIAVAWSQIKDKLTPEKSYKDYFTKQREEAQILYPSFRKDDN
jgi:hypothetical protein